MLKIQEFCKEHPENYEELLERDYAIKVKKDNGLVIFKYNQIKSDFHKPLVRECRGIILREGTWEIVCHPFHKFGNYGESYVPEIDWKSARATSKEDGSIIKLYCINGGWFIATNGTINGFNAGLQELTFNDEGIPIDSFGALFINTLMVNYNVQNFSFLNDLEDETHIFELCTPSNRVVVRYDSPKIFYLSSKDNKTGEEKNHLAISAIVSSLQEYDLANLEDCIDLVQDFGTDKEGIVVCDKYFNRIKIKGEVYVHLHHMRGEGIFTEKRALDIIRKNEMAEVLTYFPEYKNVLASVKDKYDLYMAEAEGFLKYLKSFSDKELANRKRFATLVVGTPYKDLAFKWLDGSVGTVAEYYEDFPSEKLIKAI
jgi:hypothetical protein